MSSSTHSWWPYSSRTYFSHRFTQPFEALRQARAHGHQQGHGVLDVVVGLRQKRLVRGQAHLARDGGGKERDREEFRALGLGTGQQFGIKTHVRVLLHRQTMPAPAARRRLAESAACAGGRWA